MREVELGCDRPVVEVTPEMIEAGVAALAEWKAESDYVSEQQAVTEVFLSMSAVAARYSHGKTYKVGG
jgi:hypothetical protein